jgi:putative DNA primase/helicase
VLVGTTNNEEFLNDLTGNRRYLPIDCRGVKNEEGKMFVNIPWLRQNREQLWAEAVHYDDKGEQIYFTKDDETLAESVRETHTEVDPWWDALSPLLPEEGIWSVVDGLKALGFHDSGQLTNYHFGRIAGLARSNGWVKRRITTKGATKETFFFRGEKYSKDWHSEWRYVFPGI